jgi:hypothetical protein
MHPEPHACAGRPFPVFSATVTTGLGARPLTVTARTFTRAEVNQREATILVTVVHADAGPVLRAMQATTLIVIGVSAGAATEEQLIMLADVGDGRAVAGILFAKPETAGHGTGPDPGPRRDVWSPIAQPKMSASVGAFFGSRSVFARLVQVAGEPGPLAARVALRALEDHIARRSPLLGDLKQGPVARHRSRRIVSDEAVAEVTSLLGPPRRTH